jgi:hypothetical protein
LEAISKRLESNVNPKEEGKRKRKDSNNIPQGVILPACGVGEIDLAITDLEPINNIHVVWLSSGNCLKQFAGKIENSKPSTQFRFGCGDDGGLVGTHGRNPDGRVIAVATVGIGLILGLDTNPGAIGTCPGILTLAFVGSDTLSIAGAGVRACKLCTVCACKSGKAFERAISVHKAILLRALEGGINIPWGVGSVGFKSELSENRLQGANSIALASICLKGVTENSIGILSRSTLVKRETSKLNIFGAGKGQATLELQFG